MFILLSILIFCCAVWTITGHQLRDPETGRVHAEELEAFWRRLAVLLLILGTLLLSPLLYGLFEDYDWMKFVLTNWFFSLIWV